jgi:hypothetical protein
VRKGVRERMKDMYLSPRDINAADFGLDGTDGTDCARATNAALFNPLSIPVASPVFLIVTL